MAALSEKTDRKTTEKRPFPGNDQGATKKRKRYDERPQRSLRSQERREMMAQAKTKWEQLRPKATSKEKSLKLIDDLYDLLKGRIVEFVFRHDGSRIVQWMLSNGNTKQKSMIMEELMDAAKKPIIPGERPFFVRLVCDRYGKHLADKVLSNTDKKNRAFIFETYLRGNVSTLIRNACGADVLDRAYQTLLRSRERSELVLELLYSKETKLLQHVQSKLASSNKESGSNDGAKPTCSFAESLDLIDETFRKMLLESANTTLNQFLDKENILRFELIHAAFKEYFDVIIQSEPKEKAQNLAVTLAPSLVHFAHTKPGVDVAVKCIKILDAKHRKKVVKGLKTHIRKLLEDEHGHRLIIALFEWIDDTRLVGKAVAAEIFSNSNTDIEIAVTDEAKKASSRGGKSKAEKKGKAKNSNTNDTTGNMDKGYFKVLCDHKYGRMPLLNLYFGQETRYFNPDLYGIIWEKLDEKKFDQTSKKDPILRRSELRIMFDPIVNLVMKMDQGELLQSHRSAPIVLGALLNENTKAAVISGIQKVLQGESELKKLLTNVCFRKTLATMFKVGSKKFANMVIDGVETDIIDKLHKLEGGEIVAKSIESAKN